MEWRAEDQAAGAAAAEYEPGALSGDPGGSKIRRSAQPQRLAPAGYRWLKPAAGSGLEPDRRLPGDPAPGYSSLLASGNEFTALDATLGLAPFSGDSESRLAIRPYPHQLEEWVVMKMAIAVCSGRSSRKMSHSCSHLSPRSPKKISIIAILARSTNLPMTT